jgi:hypothetical protein
MDEKVRHLTATRVRQIVRSATAANVVPIHPEISLPPTRRWRAFPLWALVAAPVLALVPIDGATPTLPEPLRVVAYHPEPSPGLFKLRLAESDPADYVVDVLINGQTHRSPEAGERRELPVF